MALGRPSWSAAGEDGRRGERSWRVRVLRARGPLYDRCPQGTWTDTAVLGNEPAPPCGVGSQANTR